MSRRTPAECGTDGGYYRHLRTTHTVPCQACLDGHAAAERLRTGKREGRIVSPINRRSRQCPECGAKKQAASERCEGCFRRGGGSPVTVELEPGPHGIWRAS